MKIKIESDGTTGLTKLTMDGTNLTEEENVVSVTFAASVRYGEWVRFGYSTREVNEDGSTEITAYEYTSPEEEDAYPVMRKIVKPKGLGKPTEDEAALLTSPRHVGDQFEVFVVDKSKITPQNLAAIQTMISGRKYHMIDTSEEDKEEDDPDSG